MGTITVVGAGFKPPLTINGTQNQQCLFGEIVDGEMQLNDTGSVIERWWCELNKKFPTVETDEFVVMPNHFHGIVVIAVGADLRVGPVPRVGAAGTRVPTVQTGANPTHQGAHIGAPLPTIIQWFKTMTTNEYMRGVKTLRWTPFRGRLWQRNYYEHVIRAHPFHAEGLAATMAVSTHDYLNVVSTNSSSKGIILPIKPCS